MISLPTIERRRPWQVVRPAVAEDMDIATEIVWQNWQAAWNAAMAEAARMEAADPIRKITLRIADESSLDLIDGESLRVDHVTRKLDATIRWSDLLAETAEYLEARASSRGWTRATRCCPEGTDA